MTHRPLLLVFTVGMLLAAGCSEQATTVVAGRSEQPEPETEGTNTFAASDERRADTPSTTEYEARELQPVEEQPYRDGPAGRTESDPIDAPGPDETPSWQDRPLASALLTADDLPAVGLGDGWELRHTGFNEIEGPEEGDALCGVPTPPQTSYFVASFENRELGTELVLNVMPADDASSATDFIDTLERMATCPNLEDDYAEVAMKLVPHTAAGADRSLVIAGTDATLPIEPIGLTLAVAAAESHLFMVFIAQDDGQPHEADTDVAVRSIELVLSRL